MKPAAFTYHRPQRRQEVDELLAEFSREAKILAGGQSLIPILNMRLSAPAHLIDINGLEDEPAERFQSFSGLYGGIREPVVRKRDPGP